MVLVVMWKNIVQLLLHLDNIHVMTRQISVQKHGVICLLHDRCGHRGVIDHRSPYRTHGFISSLSIINTIPPWLNKIIGLYRASTLFTGDETDPELDPDPDRMIPLSSEDTPSRRKSHQALPWYFKLAWFLHTIACTSGLIVSFSFFIPGQVFNPAGVEPFSVYSFHIHGVNFIIILLDVILGAVPARILHLVYPVTFALMYFIFTLIYYAAGGVNQHGVTAIYPDFLDWGGLPVGSAVVMIFAVLVASPTVHIIWYLVYRIRDGLSKRCMACCWTY